MFDEESRNTERVEILRSAIQRLQEILLTVDEDRHERIVNLITKAERTLVRLDKRVLH